MTESRKISPEEKTGPMALKRATLLCAKITISVYDNCQGISSLFHLMAIRFRFS